MLCHLVVVLVAGFYLVYFIAKMVFRHWYQQRRVKKKAAGAVPLLLAEGQKTGRDSYSANERSKKRTAWSLLVIEQSALAAPPSDYPASTIRLSTTRLVVSV
jgi:hypothetical protein